MKLFFLSSTQLFENTVKRPSIVLTFRDEKLEEKKYNYQFDLRTYPGVAKDLSPKIEFDLKKDFYKVNIKLREKASGYNGGRFAVPIHAEDFSGNSPSFKARFVSSEKEAGDPNEMPIQELLYTLDEETRLEKELQDLKFGNMLAVDFGEYIFTDLKEKKLYSVRCMQFERINKCYRKWVFDANKLRGTELKIKDGVLKNGVYVLVVMGHENGKHFFNIITLQANEDKELATLLGHVVRE